MRLLAPLLLLLGAFSGSARAAAADSAACRARFSMAAALETAAKPSGRPDDDAMRWELLAYYKWLAFAKADPAACGPLKPLRFLVDAAAPPAGVRVMPSSSESSSPYRVRSWVERKEEKE